jgi:hypothetical protein
MTSAHGFSVDVDHNPYLAVGGRDVSAVVTVTAGEAADLPLGGVGERAEIIIIDCSGSMSGNKIAQARGATAVAVDLLADGTWFAVIAGTATARAVYPPGGGMAVADSRTRAAAKDAVLRLKASGGTKIGGWLDLAREMFSSSPAVLRHAILLTDGQNGDRRRRFAVAIAACEGVFRCDCRGVGTGWNVGELRKVSTALLGTVDIVPDPAGLAADFAELVRGAMTKQIADIALRVWTPQGAAVKFVKQVAPAIDDLTGRGVPSGPQSGDYPTGAWAPGESRDYHVAIGVQPADVGRELLAGRLSLVAKSPGGEQVLGAGLVRVTWTEDESLSTRMNRRVAHFTGQEELADAIADGLAASKRGDEETATARLGRAVALAHQAGNTETARLLARVVDVVDEAAGTVALKKKVDAADEMALDTRSTKTVRRPTGQG